MGLQLTTRIIKNRMLYQLSQPGASHVSLDSQIFLIQLYYTEHPEVTPYP